MLDRRIKELRGDALAALIGSDDEAHDRPDVARGFARDALELRLRRGVAPANDATEAVCDEAVRFRGAQELAARGAVLLLGARWVVIDEPLHTEATRPVGVVRIRDHVEVVHDRVVLFGADRTDRNLAHVRSLSHVTRPQPESSCGRVLAGRLR